MNIKDIQDYAKEIGLPEKRITEFVALLHPDENGKLDTAEAIRVKVILAEAAQAREFTRKLVESGRAHRSQGEQR
jgi:hypothetical protein